MNHIGIINNRKRTSYDERIRFTSLLNNPYSVKCQIRNYLFLANAKIHHNYPSRLFSRVYTFQTFNLISNSNNVHAMEFAILSYTRNAIYKEYDVIIVKKD
jgi:hypothetical protein